uniref:Exocyst complex component 1-like n=1 Tax=Callorhinchus milii TaxID=7868 RepID=A0A4W3H2T0_CALMI
MIAIRNQLQKDVFTPQEERLLGLLFVWKAGKKRKNCILCAAVSTDRPYQTSLVKFKKADKGSVYKQVTWWSFEDLLLVDGKNPNKEAPEFDLQFDKVYRWIASSSGEKNAFMSCLLKLNRRYLHNRIKFVNISAHILEEEEEEEEVGVYQELTPKEAIDIEKLIEQFDQSISNAEAFAEKMTKDLHVLDEENIRSIIVSEKQVTEMMELIDMGLVEVNHIENTLQTYEELLQSVKEQMDHIHQSNYLLQVIDSNQQKLLEQVTFLVVSKKHQHALRNGDLSKPAGVQACIAAVEALNNCMNVKLLPGHRKMQSVAEQLIKCESLRQHFESRFIRHINNMFVLQGADQNITLTQESGDLILPNHRFYHEELLPYTPLMAWLKTSNPAIFTDLSKVYTDNIRKLYERQIKEFFDLVKFKLTGTKEGMRFSKYVCLLNQVLAELEPMCIAEEEFITKFFMMNEDRSSETVTRKMMSEIFSTLEADLKGFVNLCDKINPSNSLHLLVTVSQRALTVQDGGPCSFLKSTLGNILVQVKRNFDKCIYAFCKQIEEAKVPKKIRVVILPFVVEFDEFLNVAESIFKNTDRRGNLDKAYNKVIAAVFASVKNIASMNLKKPPDVVIMENFHHIFCCLSKMKIISLEDKKKEAYQQYTEHCNLYVTKYLGQPLEKLNNFFDGVKARISQGVKEDEVSYQLAFSKQELRKVIEKYQGKEVKKALENLYKKVTKHLSEEENLLQVVWRTMQGEFVRQYKEFEDMIARCYPGSGITMNFTVEDILQYFSDITKSN